MCLRAIGVGLLAFGASVAFAADQDALYATAEDLIRYTDNVKGLNVLMAQGLDVRKAGRNSQGRTPRSRYLSAWPCCRPVPAPISATGTTRRH